MKLSVNVDHVATLRQARGVDYPDPVEAAVLAEQAGAQGITVHLRGDRRHIQTSDVVRLRQEIGVRLNLEMAATEEMVEIALDLRPDLVTLVPEQPGEITTEGGLDLVSHGERVWDVCKRLRGSDIDVSLFLDPNPGVLAALESQGVDLVRGFEINTDLFTKRWPHDHGLEESRIRDATSKGAAMGLAVYAGHGLTTKNVGPVAAHPEIEELNIGHSIVSRAVLVGMGEAVREMLKAMAEARTG